MTALTHATTKPGAPGDGSFAFEAYLRDPPRVSYVEAEDPWLRRTVIRVLELATGRRRLEAVYDQLKAKPFEIHQFFDDALRISGIKPVVQSGSIDPVPATGPLILIANHPYGLVDGVALCNLALQMRGDFKILIHSLLCQDRDLAEHFIPIDFTETRSAVRSNITAKRVALDCLASDTPLIVFPAGGVSTRDRLGRGPLEDLPWSTFVAKLAGQSGATVLPVFFHGENSRLFHFVSAFSEPLRLALLLREALQKFQQPLPMSIGAPVTPEHLSGLDRRQVTDFLHQRVWSLAGPEIG